MTIEAQEGKRDLDFDAISEQSIYEEARDRLQIANECESENRTAAKADLEFREGTQWDKQPYTTSEALNQPQLTINLTDALVRRVVNNIKQQRPRGKAHPVSEASVDLADIINGIGRHVEYRSDAGLAYDIGAEMAVTMGWGFWRVITEWTDPKSFWKDLRILPIRNVFTVYMDPSAIMPTGQDADWCIITFKMKRTEYKRLYPRAPNIDWTDMGKETGDTDWENKEEIRLAEYFRIREIAAKLYLLKGPDGKPYSRYEDELPSPEALEAAKIGILDERDSCKRQVEWFRLNGLKVVDRAILPGQYIPVIRCEGNAVDIDGKIKRRGMVRAMQDPARMVNYGETAKIKRLGLAPQAPWIAAEGQLEGHREWSDSNNTSHPVLVYKPITVPSALGGEQVLPPPQRQPPAQIEAGFSDLVMGMRANLAAVAGMEHQPAVDTQGEIISGVAIKRRQAMSDQSHFQYYDNQTLAIAHTWRILLEWIGPTLTAGQMQRIIGEDGTPDIIQITEKLKNDIDVGKFDVVMDTGPGYETKREEGAETLINLLKIGPLAQLVAQVGADLVFRSLDHPYMQELADRIAAQTPEGLKKVLADLPERARSLVEALYAQNTKLKEQIQKDESGITKAKIDAGVKMHDTQVRAHTAKEDRELQAGVDVFIEGMKHGHETRLAEREAAQLITEGQSNGR